MNTTETAALRHEDNTPNTPNMIAALRDTITDADQLLARLERDTNTRYAYWPDQQDNGRKPDKVDGREAEPWPNASDVRVRLADEFTNDEVKICKTVAKRAKLRIAGTESSDYANAGKVRMYVSHVRETQLREEWKKQLTLAAQWRAEYGFCLTLIDWWQETAIDQDEVTIESLQEAASQDPQSPAAQLLAILYDPELRRDVVTLLRMNWPDLTKASAWRAAAELRNTGATYLPRRYLRVNRPRRRALKPFRDALHPLNMTDAQQSPWIAVRKFLTPAEVEEKGVSEGWSEEWIEALQATAGKSSLSDLETTAARRRETFRDSVEEAKGLIEVWYFYHIALTEAGIPERRYTVISMFVTAPTGADVPAGPDAPVGYKHGLYPLVEHRREDNDDVIVENRGVPAILLTHQQEMKWQRDARVNRNDLALQPPVIRPEREVGLKLTFRPRGEIGERKASSYRFGEVPPEQPGSERLEAQTRLDALTYFARNVKEEPSRAGMYLQDLVDDWLGEEAACWQMVLKLAQQFVDEVKFERVVGQTRTPIRLTRDEIQGSYDIRLALDATPMIDPDAVENRLTQLNTLVGMDRGGVINLAQAVRGIFELLFPDLADEALDDIETASAREVEDEDNNWKSMLAGVEPPMFDKGQNFQLRKMRLEQILAQPINKQRAIAAPDTAEYVKRRMDHLTFMTEQFGANAQAGRVGVLPSATTAPAA